MSNELREKAFLMLYKQLAHHDYIEQIQNIQESIENAILEFAREMCELQKQVCAENAKTITSYYETRGRDSYIREDTEIDRDSIINTKNVCEL